MAFDLSFDDTRAIKVLVVPIGRNSLFDKHFHTVSNLREIALYELSRPSHSIASSSPFKHLNWTDGALRFDFLRYDRVLVGGDLIDFQSSKRLLMIMGIINYPEIGGSESNIDEEVNFYARRHPHLLLRRIFVFNYAFDDPSEQANKGPRPLRPLRSFVADPNSLVIFPPEGLCEGGVSMIDVHLKEIMSNASLSILQAIEDQMRSCDDARLKNCLPAQLPLGTLFDEVEEQLLQQKPVSITMTVTGRPNRKLYRKRPSGRIHKWMGDLSMQACSPRDALEHYAASIVECRALNETLWLGGALEGYASAVLLLIQMQSAMQSSLEDVLGKELRSVAPYASMSGEGVGNAGSDGQPSVDSLEKIYRLAEDRINEAASIYSTNGIYCLMEAECLLRAAKMHESSPFATTREGKALAYLMRAVSVPGLNGQQQLECVLEAAVVCSRLGMTRKHALFLFVAALMSVEADNLPMALTLLQYSCKSFSAGIGVSGCTTPSQLISNGAVSELGVVRWTSQRPDAELSHPSHPASGVTWMSIRLALLASTSIIASEQGEHLPAAQYVAGLLCTLSDVEHAHLRRQKDWLNYPWEQLFLVAQDAISDANHRKFDSKDPTVSDGDSKDGLVDRAQYSAASPPPRRQASIIEGVLALPPVADGMQSLSDIAGNLSIAPLYPAEHARRIAIPKLPALLSLLPLINGASEGRDATAVPEGRVVDDLLERIRLRPSDYYSNHHSALSLRDDSAAVTGLHADPSAVSDVLRYVLQLQSPRSVALELQQEAFGLFARVSKMIPACSQLVAPVRLMRLEAIELTGSRRPVPLTAEILLETRRKLGLIRQYLRNGHGLSASTTSPEGDRAPSDNVPSSSLFYDPFAARRRKELSLKKSSSDVCWSVGETCTIRAVLANALSIPVLLDSVYPIVVGARHKVFPIAVQIPPGDKFEVVLSIVPEEVGVLKLVGLQVVCNNAVSRFEVDESGCFYRCWGLDGSEGATAASSTTRLLDVSTAAKSIRVVSAVCPLRVDASWMHRQHGSLGDGVAPEPEDSDVVTTIDLFPGEVRAECIRILNIHAPSTRTRGGRYDCRATIREHRVSEPLSKAAQCVTSSVLDFSGMLSGRRQASSSSGKMDTTANSYHLTCFSGDSDSVHVPCRDVQSAVAELGLRFQADRAVQFLDVRIEVVEVTDDVVDLIAELRRHQLDACDDVALLPIEFFSMFSDELLHGADLSLFSRVFSIRNRFDHVPGARLTRYHRLLSDGSPQVPSVHLPLSAHEARRVYAALSDLLVRHGHQELAGAHAELNLLQPRIKVLFEVRRLRDTALYLLLQYMLLLLPRQFSNDSETAMSLGTTQSQLVGSSRITPGGDQPSASTVVGISYESLSEARRPISVLPPHSRKRIVVDCDASGGDVVDDASEEQLPCWWWGTMDPARALHSGAGSPHPTSTSHLRCGKLLAVPHIVDSLGLSSGVASLSMRSGPLHDILTTVPMVAIRTYFHRVKGNESSALPIVERDVQLGDVYLTQLGSAAYFTVDILSTVHRSTTPREMQLAIIAVSNEVPVISGIDNEYGGSSVVFSGKCLSRHRLPQSDGGESGHLPDHPCVRHRVQLRFPRCGSFTAYPFVREARPGGSTGCWWTSPRAYIRIVVGPPHR